MARVAAAMRLVRRWRGTRTVAAALLAVLASIGSGGAQTVPQRVMSLNVCTDQLAMLLARPGQLASVSELAIDPGLSPLHARASAYPRNRGLAEEVFAAAPDLVVTGTYSLHNTTQLLQRLGVRVETFEYGQTLDTIPGEIRRMGRLLGNADEAEAIASEFEMGLAAMGDDACAASPTVLAYEQNGIVAGAGTLVDSAMRAVGLTNLAAERGYVGMAPFPLEVLIETRPDIIVVPQSLSDAPALADQIGNHPAIHTLSRQTLIISLPRGVTTCGGPAVIEAVRALAAARDAVPACTGPAT